ncbi:MAG: hypothetical protein K5988_11075 [Lachnospiraceae bacterium]|nr:hypothetical protein [Lachnospiraceae bacterium]
MLVLSIVFCGLKNVKKTVFDKKELVFFIVFTAIVLILSREKFGLYGMGQDQGVYQTKAIELIYGNNSNELDFEYPGETLDDEGFKYFRDRLKSLQGYYLIGQETSNYANDEAGGESGLRGIYHGVPTWPAILALFGKMFGIDHMQECQTIFYICFLMLVFYTLENFKIKTFCEGALIGVLATTPQMVWVSKSALTEMFLAVIMASFVYLLCHENKDVRLYSWIPVAVFSFFHVSVYTLMPLFVITGWLIICADKRKRAIIPVILMLATYLLGFFLMIKISTLYTSFNYILHLAMYLGMMDNKTLMILVTVTVAVSALISVILFLVLRIKPLEKPVQKINGKKGIIVKILTGIILTFAFCRYAVLKGSFSVDTNLNLIALSIACGVISMLLIFIGIFVIKTENIKGAPFILLYACFAYLVVWATLLRPTINYFYYFGRYNAPFFAILIVFLAVVYRDIKKLDLLPAVCAASILLYIENDVVLLNNPDDTKVEWSVVKEEMERNHSDNSALIIDNKHETLLEWMLTLKASGVKVYPKAEDMDGQIEELKKYYDEIYYLYEGEEEVDLSESKYSYKVVRKSIFERSEDTVNGSETWTGYPRELTVTDTINEVFLVTE